MSTSITFNGTSYTVPAIADASWGTNVSTYLIAIASGCLQKTGGAFTISGADVDFGATYGLKAPYFKSKTANIASAGVLQLARADTIGWRNQANGADLALSVDSGNLLNFNGNPIVTLALGSAYTVLQMNAGATAYSWATPTGTGAPVLATSPTLVTPTIGVATATSINKMAITAPGSSSTLAVADGKTATFSATLTFAGTDGKTLTISNNLTFAGTDGNTMTFPSGSSTVMTLASADTITGVKTFGDGKLALSGSSSGTMTVKAPAAASTYVATFFAGTDTVVGLAFQQTLTNKVFSDSTVKFGNVSDTTKALLFSLGGATGAKTMTLVSSHTNDRTLTFPDATDTLVGLATTDTLTSKTLTSPKINENVALTTTATKLNFLTSAGGTTGTASTNVVFSTSPALTTPTVATSLSLLANGEIRFNNSDNTFYAGLKAGAMAANKVWTLPLVDGAANQVLATDGSLTLQWASAISSSLNQYNVSVGDSTNTAASTNTNLLGDLQASLVSLSYAVTSASPGVFTTSAHGQVTGAKAYVTVTQNGFTANTTYYMVVTATTTFKLSTTLANAAAGTCITSSGTTAGVIVMGGLQFRTDKIPGIVTGTAVTAGYVGEKIAASITADTATVTGDTEVDVTGASIALTPGVWLVHLGAVVSCVNPTGGTLLSYTRLRMTDASNALIAGSTMQISASLGAGITEYYSISRSVTVNISAATTYKMRITCNRSAASWVSSLIGADGGAFTGTDGESAFYAIRIA